MNDLILLHPRQDHLLLESITILINRGFLTLHDPYILIRMAESIKNTILRRRQYRISLFRLQKSV